MEQLYTIPVNEAFDASAADPACGCPMCALYNRLEENELSLILGASMMEPDVRKRTNEVGFCHRHFDMMFRRKNRLGLGLILESHLEKVKGDLEGGGIGALFSGVGGETLRRLDRLEKGCYVCERVEGYLSRMFETVLLLWQNDAAFRDKCKAQPYFCLPHYRRLLAMGKETLGKKEFPDFYAALSQIEKNCLDALGKDVSWFCKKFDYRYDEEPWYNAKDAVERAIRFLSGNEGAGVEKK